MTGVDAPVVSRAPMEPTMYLPYAQEGPDSVTTIAVRASVGSAESLAHSISAAIESYSAP